MHGSAVRKEGSLMADHSKIHQYERVVVSGEGAKGREIRIYGSGAG